MTLQPFDGPPQLDQVRTIIEQIGADEMLLFSTDYPHWHFDGTDAVPAGLPDGIMPKMLVDNALATYSRLN
jgi:predicted TIM-barrel fold metal-dependent hydrolase